MALDGRDERVKARSGIDMVAARFPTWSPCSCTVDGFTFQVSDASATSLGSWHGCFLQRKL